jgi:glycosyltransferase involved in cell wall biosynthesis
VSILKTHILICCHNGALFLKEQIDSIINQQSSDFVIHIHDFASTDGTFEIADKFHIDFQELVIVTRHGDAPGACLSFFRAIKSLAELIRDDDCIFFVDQDDVWLPSKLMLVRREFKQQLQLTLSGYLVVFHDVAVVDENLNELRPSFYTGNPFSIPRDLECDRLLLANPVIGHTMAVSGKLLHRVSRIHNPSDYMMHDWATVLFASRLGAIYFIPEKLSLYRQHSSNVIGAYGRRKRSAVFGRLLKFSSSVCIQARAFAFDLGASFVKEPVIKILATKSHAYGCVKLAIIAFLKGPTLKRKLLGLFIGWNAFLTFLQSRRP